MKRRLPLLLFLLFLLGNWALHAHKPGQSFIYLRVYDELGIEGRFEIHVDELKQFFDIDYGLHPTHEQIRPHMEEIQAYLLAHSKFSSDRGIHNIVFTDEISSIAIDYGDFVNFHFDLENTVPTPDALEVTFSAFVDEDSDHTNMLGIEYNWKAGIINNETMLSLFFTQGDTTDTLSLTERSTWKGFVGMVKQGVWHIWIGLDHILFLVALILPSVVRRRREALADDTVVAEGSYRIWGWSPVARFRPAFMYILKIVTFFTIAHTITLSLAALNIIDLPSRLVESVIALSIGLAAYHNIRPIFKGEDWVIAFVFGLFHGFGFASVMSDLGFKGEFLTLTLLGFNIGVELGQVVIIALIFPILYWMRRGRFYPKFLVVLSALLILISLYWFTERILDINIRVDDYIFQQLNRWAIYLGLK